MPQTEIYKTVSEFAKIVKTSETAVYDRIRSQVLTVDHLQGRKKLLEPSENSIRFFAAERARAQHAKSLAEIGKVFKQKGITSLIDRHRNARSSDDEIARLIADDLFSD